MRVSQTEPAFRSLKTRSSLNSHSIRRCEGHVDKVEKMPGSQRPTFCSSIWEPCLQIKHGLARSALTI